MKNAATTTSLGETIAIAVKLQRPKVAEVNAVTIEVGIAEAVDISVATIVEVTVEEVGVNAVTIEVGIAEAVDISVVTTVEVTVEVVTVEETEANVETIEVEIAEAVAKGVIAITTTIAPLVENIVEAMIADLAEIPENLVVGGPKARAAPVSAEISRGAFI